VSSIKKQDTQINFQRLTPTIYDERKEKKPDQRREVYILD
jgi:hypothetical protein